MAGTPALRPTAKRFSPILLHLSFGKAFVRLLSVYQKQPMRRNAASMAFSLMAVRVTAHRGKHNEVHRALPGFLGS